MPTDIARVLMRKTAAEVQASKDDRWLILINCLYLACSVVLALLILKHGIDPHLAQSLVVAG